MIDSQTSLFGFVQEDFGRLLALLLLCGGFDPTGAPIADCELFTSDDKLERIGNPIPLPHARAGHLALQLETHQVLLVGGVGDGLRTVPDLDIYTDL